jgi:hypothetical protein
MTTTAKALAALAAGRPLGPASQRRAADCRYRTAWRALRKAGLPLGTADYWDVAYRFLRHRSPHLLRPCPWSNRLVKPICWKKGFRVWLAGTGLRPSGSALMPEICPVFLTP